MSGQEPSGIQKNTKVKISYYVKTYKKEKCRKRNENGKTVPKIHLEVDFKEKRYFIKSH